MNNTIKTADQLAMEFAASQSQARVFVRKDRTQMVVKAAPTAKRNKLKDIVAMSATAAVVAGLAIFGLQEALPALAGNTDVVICYGCEGGYSTAYDAIKALNPDASGKQITALLKDFESLNGVLDAKDIQQGTYKVPVMK